MRTVTVKNLTLTDYIKENKAQIYETARNNTVLNDKNQPTISKNDDWFSEDEWDIHHKKITEK